jgi:hypothetical protein
MRVDATPLMTTLGATYPLFLASVSRKPVFEATLAKVLLLSVNAPGFLTMAVMAETRAPPFPLTPFSKLSAQPIAHPTRRPESRTNPRLLTLSSPCRLGWEGYCEPDTLPYVMGYRLSLSLYREAVALCMSVVELCGFV